MTTIERNALVTAEPEVVSCQLGEGSALLDLRSSTYYSVNTVGADIWSQLSEPRSVAALQAAILERYDVEADRCYNDIVAILEQFAQAQLVTISDAPAP